MPIEIRMPALSPTMETGTLAKWLVAEGDTVTSGDLIAEIETDKATMEVESIDDGTVGRLVVAAGTEDVPVGAVIAVLLEEGEDASALDAASKASPAKQAPVKAEEVKAEAVKASAPVAEPVSAAAAPSDEDRVLASPLARRLAAQSGIDLHRVTGSGPGGRVVKRDLEGVRPEAKAAQAPARAEVTAPPADAPYEERRLSTMRRVIAARLTESKQTVPHFYLTVDVAMDKLLKLRRKINEGEGVKLSVNDFLIKALAVALRRVPDANVQFAGDKLYVFSRADVSVAVAIEGGLITPIIRDAAGKGLGAISTEMRDLAQKAKAGKLAPEDYQGGTVSLSNLGMYGIREFSAVINPPQAAILAVGAAEERAVVRNGKVKVATVMSATLSCDHRAIDGAIGANLLTAFKDLIENPLKMLL